MHKRTDRIGTGTKFLQVYGVYKNSKIGFSMFANMMMSINESIINAVRYVLKSNKHFPPSLWLWVAKFKNRQRASGLLLKQFNF